MRIAAAVSGAVASVFLLALPVGAQNVADTLTIGNSQAPPGVRVVIPLHLRDASGTPLGADKTRRISHISFGVSFTNSSNISGCASPALPNCSVSFARRGITDNTGVVITLKGTDSLNVDITPSSDQPFTFTSDGDPPGDLFGGLAFIIDSAAVEGARIDIKFDPDPAVTFLGDGINTSDQVEETAGNGLALVDGSLTISTCGLPSGTGLSVSYSGTGSGCSSLNSSACQAGADVTLDVHGYDFRACDVVTWSFGDDTTGSGHPVTHKYPNPGTYLVVATITNAGGSLTISRNLVVDPVAPVCSAPPAGSIDFQYGSSTGCSSTSSASCTAGTQLLFNPLATGYTFTSCDSFVWDFGDNAIVNFKTPAHTYTAPGVYTVKLTVSNAAGSATAPPRQLIISTGTQTCSTPPKTIAIEYTSSSGCSSTDSTPCANGTPVVFRAAAFGYTFQACDSYSWNFGDDTPVATTANVTHTFPAAGTYTVTLTVVNTNGSATVSRQVTITAPSPPPQRRRSR
ncbi:MAG TPA: PKD domain-containing protein [Thermoanaerobaculia bacterium]|jgi:PKD repeat protein|nr:PKD domain-containing protein [Thermoanaerobaculia bacterium]